MLQSVVLEELPSREVLSLNVLDEQALNCFEKMQCEGNHGRVLTRGPQ